MTRRRTAAQFKTLGSGIIPALFLPMGLTSGAAMPTAGAGSGVPVAAVSPAIPRDFPLDAGLTDYSGDGGARMGPSSNLRGLELDPCGPISWTPVRWADRLVVLNTGPETLQVRELLTFGSADRAARVVNRIRSDLRRCPGLTRDDGGRRSAVALYAVTTGYDDVTWSVTARDGSVGGYVAQAMRVGSAVLLNFDYGEYSGRPRFGARVLNRNSREFAPRLCRWTVTGC